jgi:hypothetical protein
MAEVSDAASSAATNTELVAAPAATKQIVVTGYDMTSDTQSTVSLNSGPATLTVTETTAGVTGVKEVSTVDIGTATGGTWVFTVDGNNSGAIAYNASAGTVETAVEAITGVTAATVTGAGTGGDPWIITIDDPIAALTITGDGSLLTPSDDLTVTETTPGVTAVAEVSTIDRGLADAGTFTLTVDAQTTSALDWDVSAAALDTAITALSSVTSCTVSGTGSGADPWIVTFVAADGAQAVSGTATGLVAVKSRKYLAVDRGDHRDAPRGGELFRCTAGMPLTYSTTGTNSFVSVNYEIKDTGTSPG